jgi:hypothetical protein
MPQNLLKGVKIFLSIENTLKYKYEKEIITQNPGEIMKITTIKRSRIYFAKKLYKLFYRNQSESDKNSKDNITFKLKAIKMGEEIKYFRIPQE